MNYSVITIYPIASKVTWCYKNASNTIEDWDYRYIGSNKIRFDFNDYILYKAFLLVFG
jgi:hypothetical protein